MTMRFIFHKFLVPNFRLLQSEILFSVPWLRFLLLYVRYVVNAQVFHCLLVSRCHKFFQRKVSYNCHSVKITEIYSHHSF